MTTTESEIRDPATGNPATGAGDGEDGPQLARARDGILADLWAALPDTESFRRVKIAAQDFTAQVRSKEIWDIQPPSLAELCNRTLDGPWNSPGLFGEPGWRCKTLLARTGMAATLVWSAAFYALALAGQPWWLRGERSARLGDLQPPPLRDLAGRVIEGPWMTSDERLLHAVAAAGLAISLAWTVTCYTLAVASQRFWRAFWATALVVLIWKLT